MGGTKRARPGVRGSAALAGAALLLTVTACTDASSEDVTAPSFRPASPEPSATATATATVEPTAAEPSPEPGVAAPPLPEAAKEQTPEGAVAFTEWWFETLNYATVTGDTEGLRAASDPGCTTCDNYAAEIEDTFVRGGHIDGGTFNVTASNPGAIQDRGVNVAIIGFVDETLLLDESGETIQTYESGAIAQVATLLITPKGWSMASIGDA